MSNLKGEVREKALGRDFFSGEGLFDPVGVSAKIWGLHSTDLKEVSSFFSLEFSTWGMLQEAPKNVFP